MEIENIIVAYGELFLKSDLVMKRFKNVLLSNIISGLKKAEVRFEIHQKRARTYLKTKQVLSASKVLKKIFGVVWFAPAYYIPTSDIETIKSFCEKFYPNWIKKDQSFALRIKRVGNHPYTSNQLAVVIGDVIKRKVNLKKPEVEIFIEIRDNHTYVYLEKQFAPGGLPLGTSGNLVSLISGGIDSPVATWLMMKRGCIITALFARFPGGGEESDLVRFLKVMKVLKAWHIGKPMKCYIYNHKPNLVKFRKEAPKRYVCVLCRRMMYRVANGLAEYVGAKGIVTGENLAQVASQTLDNLRVIDQATKLPVFRPVIGLDKMETIKIAKEIGSYGPSSIPIKSGCVPKTGCWARPDHPVTKARLDTVLKIEEDLEIDTLLKESISSLKEIKLIP
jgi:thiamine biosynthesis protein ThiI